MTSSPPSPSFHLHTSLRYDPALLQVHRNPSFTHAGYNYHHPSPLYMLDLHRDRILRAATHFHWTAAVELLTGDAGLSHLSTFILAELQQQLATKTTAPARVRVSVTESGTLSLSIFPAPHVPLQNLFPSKLPVLPCSPSPSSEEEEAYIVTLDSSKTSPSEYTHFKTTHRPMYDTARQRARINLPSEHKEVLLVNEADNSVMEGSITTPYFWRNGRWVTPPVSARYEGGVKRDSGGNDGTTRRWAVETGLVSEEVVLADSFVDGEDCWLSNGARGFLFGRIKLERIHIEWATSRTKA